MDGAYGGKASGWRLRLGRVHAAPQLSLICLWACQVGKESPRRIGLGAGPAQAGGEDGRCLDLGRQGTDNVDPRQVAQLAELLKPQINLPLRQQGSDRHAW